MKPTFFAEDLLPLLFVPDVAPTLYIEDLSPLLFVPDVAYQTDFHITTFTIPL